MLAYSGPLVKSKTQNRHPKPSDISQKEKTGSKGQQTIADRCIIRLNKIATIYWNTRERIAEVMPSLCKTKIKQMATAAISPAQDTGLSLFQ